MVYCGKPSRGCQMCRTRRIKCDETRPTCNQCTKSRRQCPGYKDDFDLVFRNETKATERRAKRANKKAWAQRGERHDAHPDNASSSSSRPSTSATTVTGIWAVATSPTVPVEDQASCLFISNFVLMPRDGSSVGHLDFVLPLLNQAGPDSHIQHAFNACSMTFLNNRKATGGRYWDAALSEYSIALARTNVALRDRETQLSDATLAAVLLLGMFENISAKQISAFNWGSHVDGAVQLVKARGKRQNRTKIGFQLFVAVRTLMSVYCLTASRAPTMGADWWMDSTAFSKTALGVQKLMIKTSEVRAQAAQLIDSLPKSPENIELMLEVIRKTQVVDQEVAAWQQSLPEEFHYKTVAWEDSVLSGDCADAEVFPGRVDVYTDVWTASAANSSRTLRLILQAIIVRCTAWACAPVDYRTTPEYATAAGVCRDAITDIIAAVPYFLGWHLRRKEVKTTLGNFACGQEDSPKGLAGYLLTWHLTIVVSQDYATIAQREWVKGRLRKIGNELGVKYALAMCQVCSPFPPFFLIQETSGSTFAEVVASRYSSPAASSDYAPNAHQQWEAATKPLSDPVKDELFWRMTKSGTGDEGTQTQRNAQRWVST
ncbi:hypothetical protein F4808DRAFT_451875 [Astrocystis sublimbata]|nr:hypothetical protein F4808DRAFT_451875 [Astrocystis sublimbata]